MESAILAHNSEAVIVRTEHCSVPISQILNKAAFAGSHRHPSQVLQLHPRQARIPMHTSNSAEHQNSPDDNQLPTALTQTHKAVPSASEAVLTSVKKGDIHQRPQRAQASKATTGPEDQQPAAAASVTAQTDTHASQEGNTFQPHGQSHGHSHHLDSVTSISLVKHGQVDLAR